MIDVIATTLFLMLFVGLIGLCGYGTILLVGFAFTLGKFAGMATLLFLICLPWAVVLKVTVDD